MPVQIRFDIMHHGQDSSKWHSALCKCPMVNEPAEGGQLRTIHSGRNGLLDDRHLFLQCLAFE